MKATDHFKNTIKAYLDQRAESDVLFSFQYTKPDKNIDDCVTYILNYVQKSGFNGFSDEEIYSQAVHYYDEKNIDVGNPIDCQVVVNHVVKLTAEEEEQARQNAIQKAEDEAYRAITRHTKTRTTKPIVNNQLSLF